MILSRFQRCSDFLSSDRMAVPLLHTTTPLSSSSPLHLSRLVLDPSLATSGRSLHHLLRPFVSSPTFAPPDELRISSHSWQGSTDRHAHTHTHARTHLVHSSLLTRITRATYLPCKHLISSDLHRRRLTTFVVPTIRKTLSTVIPLVDSCPASIPTSRHPPHLRQSSACIVPQSTRLLLTTSPSGFQLL